MSQKGRICSISSTRIGVGTYNFFSLRQQLTILREKNHQEESWSQSSRKIERFSFPLQAREVCIIHVCSVCFLLGNWRGTGIASKASHVRAAKCHSRNRSSSSSGWRSGSELWLLGVSVWLPAPSPERQQLVWNFAPRQDGWGSLEIDQPGFVDMMLLQ